jgi:hypothetical protein
MQKVGGGWEVAIHRRLGELLLVFLKGDEMNDDFLLSKWTTPTPFAPLPSKALLPKIALISALEYMPWSSRVSGRSGEDARHREGLAFSPNQRLRQGP